MSSNIDWDKLTFSFTQTDYMYFNTCGSDGIWGKGEIRPFGLFPISPAAAVLNYGQGLFEGLKALRTKNDEVLLFRPDQNAKRFAEGAKRLLIPAFPEDRFVEAVKQTVKENRKFVPPYGKGSLYIRPCLWGTGPILGVAPALEYTLVIFVSPVGAYYKSGLTPLKFKVSEDFHRSSAKGLGHVKFIGNYTGGMMHSLAAKKEGFSGCIFLDSSQERYIEEAEAANFFCVIDGKLVTPKLGQILPGITRDSVIQLAKTQLGLEVIEKDLEISEALKASECFCSGTAAIISPIGLIQYKQKKVEFNHSQVGPVTQKIYDLLTHIQLNEMDDPFSWVQKID